MKVFGRQGLGKDEFIRPIYKPNNTNLMSSTPIQLPPFKLTAKVLKHRELAFDTSSTPKKY
ncbi:hypothetical protein CJ030_MR6G023543 [Morella rubra]|uniref:Uncharacterized protein n=1 Tax=Morella rubra TaxID=262757 RepID=A0A6A1VB27_9ROSI|nr:hypothetical protein CJ030_MR6G023543 [Morella rubra]